MESLLIRELIDRYHAAVNRHDWRMLGDVFTQDAVWEALEPVNLRFEGKDAVLEGLRASVLRQELLVQTCAGVVVDITGERSGKVQSTLIELGRETAGEAGWMAVGFYDDLVRKDGEVWRFARRTLTVRYQGPPDLTGPSFPLAQ